MNLYLLTASNLTFSIGLGHSWLGEKYIITRLLSLDNLSRLFGSDLFVKRTLRFAWHITTIAWWGYAAILLVLSSNDLKEPERNIAGVIAVTFYLTSFIGMIVTRGRHLSWIVFLAIAVLATIAAIQ